MPRVELWLWWVIDPRTGKRRRTRFRMTDAEAREACGDTAERVANSLEVRDVPDGGERTGAWLNKG